MGNKTSIGRRKGIVILITICIGIIMFSALGLNNCLEIKEESRYKISVIVYGTDEARWNNLKQGLNQAALDYSVNVNFVIMYEVGKAEGQKRLLQRELQNGAQAIAIASTDSKEMAEIIEETSRKVPVILLEAATNMGENTAQIGPDNEKLGEDLAIKLTQESGDKSTIAIIYENTERESISQRLRGLEKVLDEKKSTYLYWEREIGDFNPSIFLQKELKKEQVDAVVALDDYNLENIIDAIEGIEGSVSLYGIGNTEKAVHYLDQGIVDTLLFSNEYNMGYLSIKSLVEKLQNNTALYDQEIKYSIVNRDNLYEKENQRLLFPMVQ